MRTKDEKKISAIKTAVIDLCQKDGFTNLTTAKVAKEAGVSPATIYLYYADKTDLLSRLYEEVKRSLHQGLTQQIEAAGPDLEQQLKAMLSYSVERVRQHPKESHFISALWTNQELLDDQAIEFGQSSEAPVTKLYNRLEQSDQFIDMSQEVFETFATVPTMVLQLDLNVTASALEQSIQMVIKAMKK